MGCGGMRRAVRSGELLPRHQSEVRAGEEMGVRMYARADLERCCQDGSVIGRGRMECEDRAYVTTGTVTAGVVLL